MTGFGTVTERGLSERSWGVAASAPEAMFEDRMPAPGNSPEPSVWPYGGFKQTRPRDRQVGERQGFPVCSIALRLCCLWFQCQYG